MESSRETLFPLLADMTYYSLAVGALFRFIQWIENGV